MKFFRRKSLSKSIISEPFQMSTRDKMLWETMEENKKLKKKIRKLEEKKEK